MSLIHKVNSLFSFIPEWFVLLLVRVALAVPFWFSGIQKTEAGRGWEIWNVSDLTVTLFAEQFKVPVLGPETAAILSSIGEHVFPVLLVLGLFSRLGATGLFFMTLVIQLFVFPASWPVHILWFALALTVMAMGPGAASLDRLLGLDKKRDETA